MKTGFLSPLFICLLLNSLVLCQETERILANNGTEDNENIPSKGSTPNTNPLFLSNSSAGLYDSKGKIRLTIGHIGAIGALRNDVKILEVSHKSLLAEGILDEDLDVEIISQTGCGESYEGVAVAADMYHLQKVKAFIGPYCNAEMDAVARMAAFWNIPIIGYMAASNNLADKNAYPTLARISMRTTNSIAEATCAMLRHYGWNKVAIVTNTGVLAYDRVISFEEVFHQRGISVVKKIMFDEFADSKAMVASGLLNDIKNSARIVVCLFSNTRETSREFLTAANTQGMSVNEYGYVFPWLQDGGKDIAPWTGSDGSMLQKVKDQYANAIIVSSALSIDDVNSFDNTIIGPFVERIKDVGLTEADVDIANIYGYLYLFDALKLYALAARKVLNETGKAENLLNGRMMWQNMRKMKFIGMVGASGIASGLVSMDDRAERAPLYRGFFVSPNTDAVLPMVHMEPTMLDNCDGIANKSGCYEIVVTDIMRDFWPSIDRKMPKDEPDCGFRNERCDYTLIIIGAALILLFIIAAVSIFFAQKLLEKRALDKLPFRIYRDDLQFIDEEQLKSMLSLGSTRTKMSNMNYGSRNHAIVGTNTHAIYHKYVQRRPIIFNRADKTLIQLMKAAVHDNINPFLGMVWNEKEEMLLVWKFCSRGTLQDIIYNDNIQLDTKFHGAFIRDILAGLEYLHASQIGYHGSLTPWSCLIDRNWMVKLTDYGIADPLERWEKQQSISRDALTSEDDKSQATQSTSILYESPEMLKNREKNRVRRVDQDWMRQTQARRQLGDVYAFGLVMYEIIFRALPFPEGTNQSELVEWLKDGTKVVKPVITQNKVLNMDLTALIQDCWNTTPEMRPSLRRIKLNVETYLNIKGSLVDQMTRMMEQYANNLEKLVAERTGMLEEANQRADRLLSQLLPAYVANELKLGRPVPPKTFTGSTVLFSDIVGFTEMCQHASPLEVVSVLNGIFDGFDQFIARKDAYKVETIGDAYMVVSGVPEENGHRHINEIASIALDVHKFLSEFVVPHKRDTKVQCRLGFHTGPVAAAVVGLNAPRYCLFGDTVNMASRMESNGEPGKTQISETAKNLLLKEYPDYICEQRGEIPIKGKGMCMTYWLMGTKSEGAGQSGAYLAPSMKSSGSGFSGMLGSTSSNDYSLNLRNPTGLQR
ncbi:CRE-GCY-8 protein [Caenorhabditis remanei]|uniref:guanylate cyclase n=1 Tax=Caenorhabditis remanei TaxID=31234 RepID=E3M4Z2_CAERE|nr:CRE-GCY-8 protein [Caenorhabditis remanei]